MFPGATSSWRSRADRRYRRPLPTYLGARDGNIALLFGLLAPVLMLLAGGTIEFLRFQRQKSVVQSAADAASVAGAKTLSMSNTTSASVASTVEAVTASYLASDTNRPGSLPYQVVTNVITTPGQPLEVQVTLTQTVPALFGHLAMGDTTLNVASFARVQGKPNLCLLALDPSAMGTIYLEKSAKIVGNNCAAYSNSTHPNSIKAFNSSYLTASMICTAGGKAGKANFSPDPLTDCPQFPDPLADRPEPSAGPCISTGLVITSQTTTLNPGTYCGGLTINGSSTVTLQPGLYVIKDGAFTVDGTAAISGTNVGIYLTGKKAVINFTTNTTIALSGPTSGTMGGLLIFASRSQSGESHTITSNNAATLTGTIYMPTGELTVGGSGAIGSASAYTAIVVDKLTGTAGPTVTLNSDYEQTDVPVPDGIRGVGQAIALVR